MAKTKKTTNPARRPTPEKTLKATEARTASELPVCIALMVCDRVIIDKNDTVSAIRIVDTITLPQSDIPKEYDGIELPALTILAILKKGESEGSFDYNLVCVDPNKNRRSIATACNAVMTGEPQAGNNINTPLRLSNVIEGLYWIELLANNSLIGRTPFKVLFEKQKTGKPSD